MPGAIGPIPWDRIVWYGQWKKLDEVMLPVFVSVIRGLDEAYIKWESARAKNQTTR